MTTKLLSFLLLIIALASCSKRKEIKPEDEPILTIEIGWNYWGFTRNAEGEYIEEPFHFGESSTAENTGRFIFNYNPKGNLDLKFFPSKNKLKSKYPLPAPNGVYVTSEETVYAILSKKDNSVLVKVGNVAYKKAKLIFKDNLFILVRDDWETQIERLTNGITGNFSSKEEKFLNIKGEKIILN
ncbi:hypothetical protein D0T08_12560 [Emticicia sp. C21]|nr:hypothetical protein D0T08_12560 [Emticicia sp. C21]